MKVKGIPCCLYPTTILFVDDDEDFLRVVCRKIGPLVRVFASPSKALEYLTQARFTAIEKNCFIDQDTFNFNERSFVMDITKIHTLMDDPQRFEEISIVVVDYQMPDMTGLEFCRRIKDHNVKIVMLTGEAGLELAIDAFNQGVIDKFIRKDTPNIDKELSQTLTEMQFKHFQDASHFFIDSLSNGDSPALPGFLQNAKLIDFFKRVLHENNIVEYYLLNYFGDFVMINQQGEQVYFILRDEVSLNRFIVDAKAKYMEEPDEEAEKILISIQKKEQIPFLYSLADEMDFNSWHKYMHPLTVELCDGAPYYYTLIKQDPYDRGLRV